jgi:rubrerythrin
MAKYTLICEHDELGGTMKQTTEFRTDYLPDVLENTELFLRGCGFYFEGQLDIVDEDKSYESFTDTQDEFDVFQQIVNSHQDFLDKKESPGICNICGLSTAVMQGQKCFDTNCPKGY